MMTSEHEITVITLLPTFFFCDNLSAMVHEACLPKNNINVMAGGGGECVKNSSHSFFFENVLSNWAWLPWKHGNILSSRCV